MFEEASKKILKPLPNQEFKRLIQKHNEILKSNVTGKVRFINGKEKFREDD